MGTQQMLIVVLAIIIVGTSLIIGINMYNKITENNLRQAISKEIQDIAQKAQLFYKRPVEMSGLGAKATIVEVDLDIFYEHFEVSGSTEAIETMNAEYKLDLATGDSLILKISAVAKANDKIILTAVVDLKGLQGDKGLKIKHSASNVSDYPSF
jgi:sensor domain CHASE-containing protein